MILTVMTNEGTAERMLSKVVALNVMLPAYTRSSDKVSVIEKCSADSGHIKSGRDTADFVENACTCCWSPSFSVLSICYL